MAKINLRNYHEEIESLINRGQYDEAIAHCRHILQIYPKSVDTYRLLGKAFLEARRYTDAIDIFERVLSAVPDDFVSHLGLSIIREDEGSLDAAIWHMERAFEIQPYNGAIQEELRRLYERRDGSAPPKIRMTRAALARMYAKGNLYQQAIAETRSILNEEPQRFDLQLLLGNMYLKTGKQVEAAEISSKVLKKLPYCMVANQVLVGVLQDSEHKQEYQQYRERLSSLNPYESFATANLPTGDSVPNDSVQLEKLDVAGQQLISTDEKADWMATLGLSSSDFDTQIDEDLPDWLVAASAQIMGDNVAEPTAEDQDLFTPEDIFAEPEADIDSIEWLGEVEEDLEVPADQMVPEEEIAQEEIPDWMVASGWETPDADAEVSELESASVDELGADGELDQELAADTLAQGEIPDWLRDLAPDEIDDTELEDQSAVSQSEDGEDHELAALFAAAAVAKLAGDEVDQETPEDSLSLEEAEGEPTAEAAAAAAIASAELADAMTDDQVDAPAEEIEGPDWLNEFAEADIEVDVETPEDAAAPDSEDLPEWLTGIEDELDTEVQSAGGLDTSSEDELPEWLREFDDESEAPTSTEAETVPDMESSPDWLAEGPSEISEEVLEVEEAVELTDDYDLVVEEELVEITGGGDEPELEGTSESIETEFDEPPDFADADDALAWLAGLAAAHEVTASDVQAETTVDSAKAAESLLEEQVELPEEAADTEEEVPALQGEIELESPPDFEDVDDAVAWLAGLAAGQPQQETASEVEEPIQELPEVTEAETIEDQTLEAEEALEVDKAEPPATEVGDNQEETAPAPADESARPTPIDVNTASLVEIERLPGVGYRNAQAIVAYREEHGTFTSIDELVNVPGIDPDEIFSLSEMLFVQSERETLEKPASAKQDQGLLQSARQSVASGEISTAIQQYTDLINEKASLEEVIFDLNRLLQNREDDFELWQLLGDAYMRNNQLIEAMQAYNKAEELLR